MTITAAHFENSIGFIGNCTISAIGSIAALNKFTRAANVQKHEAELAAAKEATKAGKMTVDRKQLELKTGEAKILTLRTKLNTCGTNKEYQALLDQIAAAEMANSVCSDEILEGFEKVDELTGKIAEAEKVLAVGKVELARIEKQVGDTIETIRGDIARLEQDLREAEKSLPVDFRADYERIVKAKAEDALAEVEGDCCGGCFQQITANMLNDLYMSRAVFCRSCGRLMYLSEDREPGHSR